MYKFFGWLNVALVVIITAPWWLRKLNQALFHVKKPWFQKLLKALRFLHKPLALVLLVSIFMHGYLVMGGFPLHTGTVAAIAFLVTACFGALFYFLKKPGLFKAHKILALAAVLLAAVHYFFPRLLSSLGS